MKKVYQLIAAASLSLLTVGAFAQIPSNVGFHHLTPRNAQQLGAKSPNTKRVTGGPVHAYVDNVGGDEYINTGLTFYYWNPPLYMNMAYTLADTTYSPYVTNAANTNTPNYCTVCYDTLWDDLSQTFYPSYTNIKKGSMMVDTIWAYMGYNNNSGMNDTVIFQVNSVDANGFPAATQYGADTVILNNGTLNYNVLDSLQVVYVVPKTPIMIPSTARHGWNFCINMKVHGSKMDTVGVWYFSQGSACTNGSVTSAYTSIGVPDGHCPCVNSFVTGNYWFNQPSFSGTGTALTWPTFTGSYPGYCTNGTYYWYNQLQSGCTDTSYFPEQDIAIMASVDFQDPTGVNEVASKDFSVGQNYPNPFNNSTEITYNLTKESNVVFTVYDMTGRELVNNNYATVAPGQHVVSLSATQFTPGIYFYTFNVNGIKVTRKMVITQ